MSKVHSDTGVAGEFFSVFLPLDEVHPLLARLGGAHLQALFETASAQALVSLERRFSSASAACSVSVSAERSAFADLFDESGCVRLGDVLKLKPEVFAKLLDGLHADTAKQRIFYAVVRAFMQFVEVEMRSFVCSCSGMHSKVVAQFKEHDIQCNEIFAKILASGSNWSLVANKISTGLSSAMRSAASRKR